MRACARLALPVLACLSPAVLGACASPFAGDTLAALPAAEERGEAPGEEDWARAVPLDLTAWKGNVHVRPEVVALDAENSHKSTAACHHGTDNSRPVQVRLLALRTADELFIRAEWEDPTPDGEGALGLWTRGKDGIRAAAPGADDGIALMWAGAGAGAPALSADSFRCQRACHMTDVGLANSETLMQMKMMAPAGKRYDAWRWRAAVTAPFGLADDMVVEEAGKRGDEGQVVPRENPRPELVEGPAAPYWISEEPRGREAQVRAAGIWRDGRWTVTFRRALATGDPDDVSFGTAGDGEREGTGFSVAVFDHTFREHHVAGRTFRLRPVSRSETRKEVELDPMDF